MDDQGLPHPSFVSVAGRAGATCVSMHGDLDLAGGAHLLDAALRLASGTCGPAPVVVDLSGVTFVDCAGIRALDDALAHLIAAGAEVTARRPSPTFERMAGRLRTLPGVSGPTSWLWSDRLVGENG